MKKIILLFGLLILFSHLQAQYKYSGEYVIRGDVSSIKGAKKIYNSYVVNSKNIIDSAIVENGHFVLHGQLDEPKYFAILSLQTIDEKRLTKNEYSIYLEPTQMDLIAKDSLSGSTIKGSIVQDEYLAYRLSVSALYKAGGLFHTQYKQAVNANDKIESLKVAQKVDSINLLIATKQKNFVVNHPKSPVALVALYNYYNLSTIGPKAYASFYNLLDLSVQKLPLGVELGQRHHKLTDVAEGNKAKTFTLLNEKDQSISLENFKGKYVFLDFWASWCKNCLQEMPFIKKAYETFKGKDFVVIMVSIDSGNDKKEKWINAINKQNMQMFINLLDEEKWSGKSASEMYYVSAIPRSFLIDPNGVIIANNLSEFQLGKKLEEILKL